MRIIKKIILFFCILYLICFLLQLTLDEGLKKSNFSSNYKEWNDIFHGRINADILIQGSSRAWVHISPRSLESNFNMSAYNLGLDGYRFLMQYYRYKAYEKYCNKKPKYILQALDLYLLGKNDGLYEIEQFIPYLSNGIIKEATSSIEGFDFRDYYIPLFKYTHKKDIVMFGFMNLFNKDALNNGKYKGFQAMERIWDSKRDTQMVKKYLEKPFKLDINTYMLFNNFLTYCKKENIKVVLIYTPDYYKVQKIELNRDSIMQLYRNFSIKYNIPFLDYSKDSICFNTKYFYNSEHLNKEGVKIFNKHLVSDLKNIIM